MGLAMSLGTCNLWRINTFKKGNDEMNLCRQLLGPAQKAKETDEQIRTFLCGRWQRPQAAGPWLVRPSQPPFPQEQPPLPERMGSPRAKKGHPGSFEL